MNNYQIIKKQLKVNGIILMPNMTVHCLKLNKNISVFNKIKILLEDLRKQKNIFIEIFKKMQQQLLKNTMMPHNENSLDREKVNLFMFSIKDINKFSLCFGINSKIVSESIKKDVSSFDSNIIYSIPDYRMSIQISFRKIEKINHLLRLLNIIKFGQNCANKNRYQLKTAAGIQGIQGPMSNLDFPIGERIYQWRDVGEQFQGKLYDTQNQKRYKLGLQTYNGHPQVGQGFYMRDLKGQPYLWENRFDDGPIPALKSGTWR